MDRRQVDYLELQKEVNELRGKMCHCQGGAPPTSPVGDELDYSPVASGSGSGSLHTAVEDLLVPIVENSITTTLAAGAMEEGGVERGDESSEGSSSEGEGSSSSGTTASVEEPLPIRVKPAILQVRGQRASRGKKRSADDLAGSGPKRSW